MNQELENLNPISIDEIKECLKNTIPAEYDKMIISSDTQVKRADYFYIKYKSTFITREGKIVKFPLYGAIKDNFAEIEGGEQKHGERAILTSEKFLDNLAANHNIEPDNYYIEAEKDPYEFPIEVEGNEVLSNQKKYFFPDLTFQEQCSECNGQKYITCTDYDCEGKHEWVCPDCDGDRKIICDVCSGDRKVTCKKCSGDGKITCKDCKGNGFIKCGGGIGNFAKRGIIGNVAGGGCNGSGYVKDGEFERKCKTCNGKGEVVCKTCGRKGEVRCEKCNGRGEVSCSNCNAQGTLPCRTCDATGKIVCEICYGDKDRYGMVDCPNCDTQGATAQVVFVETKLHNNSIERIYHTGELLAEITDEHVLSQYCNKSAELNVTRVNINDNKKEVYDEYTKMYSDILLGEFGHSLNDFPKIAVEEMNYQVIPCIQFSYKHMLTNQYHEISVLNFFKAPEVILHGEAEELKKDMGNTGKAVGGLFGRLFKTKAFKTKEDRKNEIILMIYLAKADGKVEEEEKTYLSELIGNLDDFTSKEKKEIFDLMNSPNMPELNLEITKFSSKDRADEVVSNLEKLASADGEIEGREEQFIEAVKSVISF